MNLLAICVVLCAPLRHATRNAMVKAETDRAAELAVDRYLGRGA